MVVSGDCLIDVIGARYGGLFARAGIRTVGDLAQAVRCYKLGESGPHAKRGYYFASVDAPGLRQSGPKTWRAALGALEQIGFDWRAHVVNLRGSRVPTAAEFEARIDAAIAELTRLLEEYRRLRSS